MQIRLIQVHLIRKDVIHDDEQNHHINSAADPSE